MAEKTQRSWQSLWSLATIKLFRPLVCGCCTEEGMLTTSPAHKHFMVSLMISLRDRTFLFIAPFSREWALCVKLEPLCLCSTEMGKDSVIQE